ncbi:MAG: Gfo/Idh/MocA family oxidoreductase [Armatimonadota bacterium]|nr:Gfo/Idh/MocA family oxidoreductase [bacterium]
MAVRVGFVGAGGIASAHMNALQMLDDVQIVAVSDVVHERAESAAARYLARAYSDYREMIASEGMDALYVCVPPFAHVDQELLAAEKGIHLFVEKPVSHDIEKACEIGKAIKRNNIISAVGYHWRYQSNTDRARELLQGRKIGMVQGYWMGGMPGVGWWRSMEKSGGQMVDQTTHIVDLARYLCGEVIEVCAAYGNQVLNEVPQFDVYDVGTCILKFANGVIGSISNTCILDVPYTVGLHIVARNLVLEMHGDLKVIEPGHTEVFAAGHNPMFAETAAFIHAVKTGDTSGIRSSYDDATKTLEVTLACNESAKTGQPVRLVS